jgi:Tol biopolymer transport system component
MWVIFTYTKSSMPPDDIEQKLDDKEKPADEFDKVITEFDQPTPVELAGIEAQPQPEFVESAGQLSSWERLKARLASKKLWITIFLMVAVVLLGAWFVQTSRLWMVNALGGRAILTVTVLASGSGNQGMAELQNAIVTVNGRTFTTNQQGKAIVTGQHYGLVSVMVIKKGYQMAGTQRMLDFDPFFNKLGGKDADVAARNVRLIVRAVGLPASFKAVDWLTGQPITRAQYQIGDVQAHPDANGQVNFTAPVSGTVMVKSNLFGAYVDKTFEVTAGNKTSAINFVPTGTHYFLHNQDGKVNLYGSDLDGSNQQLLVAGTGKEVPEAAFMASPSGKYGVLVSGRDGAQEASTGLTVVRLYVVDLTSHQLTQVDEAPHFALADWAGDKLPYYKYFSNASTALRIVDLATGKVNNIAKSSNFSALVVSLSQVAYAATNDSAGTAQQQPALHVYNSVTGAGKQVAAAVNGQSVMQITSERLAYQSADDQKWHEYNFKTGARTDIIQPSVSAMQKFASTLSPDGSKALRLDYVNGKFVLYAKNMSTGEEKQLYASAGLTGPIRWVGSTVTFRVVDDTGAADFVISPSGGDPKKISDVTPTITNNYTDSQQFKWY